MYGGPHSIYGRFARMAPASPVLGQQPPNSEGQQTPPPPPPPPPQTQPNPTGQRLTPLKNSPAPNAPRGCLPEQQQFKRIRINHYSTVQLCGI